MTDQDRHEAAHLVIAFAGYTKARKSTLSRLFSQLVQVDIIEMSAPFREAFGGREPAFRELMASLDAFRTQHGKDALAAEIARRVRRSTSPACLIVGLRSAADHAYLKREFPTIVTVFVHTSAEHRQRRLADDSRSIAKDATDYAELDRRAYDEGLGQIALMADHVLVNEPGYPLTPLEQLVKLRDSLPSCPRLQTEGGLGGLLTPLELVKVTRLIVDTGADADSILRQLKSSGQLATATGEEIDYVGSLEFPADGLSRANHFYEEKVEFLYVTHGKIRLSYRRGGQKYDRPEQVVLEAGCFVRILPGVAHAFVATESGRALEFVRSSRQVIHSDVVPDDVVG
ncbi:MAG: hypothetical protein AAB403_00085 [Planctomycetota bacterium]|mgnify:CR=1 FL=1